MKFEFSAGGIVFKRRTTQKKNKAQNYAEVFVLVSQHSQHHGWVFPKGLIGDKIKGEKKEKTAIREVKEETGIDAKILKPFPPVTYWYVFEGEKIKKTVYYYLMEFKGGNTEERDFEMEKVEWLPIEKVEQRLTYKSDKEVWEVALRAINRRLTKNK
ncbi:MAG: NUDIX domain-containing protein [Patescibacteria group bacterium]|nr:NUDIX domain-containing protein [Patescibacteria group bacterium]